METSCKSAGSPGQTHTASTTAIKQNQYNRSQANHKKLPPFGKLIVGRQKSKSPPRELRIAAGPVATDVGYLDPWDFCSRNIKSNWPSLLLPEGENPNSLQWPVSVYEVFILPGKLSFDAYIDLTDCLIIAGAVAIRVSSRPEEHGSNNLPPVYRSDYNGASAAPLRNPDWEAYLPGGAKWH